MRALVVSLSTYSSLHNRGKLESLSRRVDHLTAVSGDVRTIWGNTNTCALQGEYELHVLPCHLRVGWALRTLKGLSEIVHRTAPEIVHVEAEPWQAVTAQAVMLAQRAGTPVGVQFAESGPQMQGASGRLRREAARQVLRRCDYAIGWAQASSELASALAPHARILTMPGTGFEVDGDADIGRSTSEERAHWFGETPPGSHAIGFVARLAPEKGVSDFMAACDALVNRLDIRIAIAGAGPLENAVETWARERTWVRTHGLVSRRDATRCAASADVILIPSRTIGKRREQFGKVAIEAMAAGTPIVCYACGALPEVVGPGGTVVPEGDVAALVTATERYLRLPEQERQRISALAVERAADFSNERLAERLVELWAEISGR